MAAASELCVRQCGRKTATGFPTCCRSCTGPLSRHGPMCDQLNPGAKEREKAAQAALNSAAPLCQKGCGRKKAQGGKFPTCCRSCRGPGSLHGPTCDADNGVQPVTPFGAMVHPKPAILRTRSPKPGARVKLFLSGHITNATFRAFGAQAATEVSQVWLPPEVWRNAEKKASTPPFNTKLGEYGEGVECYNVPTYGPALTNVLMSIFEFPALQKMAENLQIAIPPCSLNRVIVGKMAKVEQLVEFFQRPKEQSLIDFLTPADQAALKKLDDYRKIILGLDASTTVAQWHEKVDRFMGSHTWTTKLSLDTVLESFGFSAASSKKINDQPMPATPGAAPGPAPQTWGQYSLRWVSKSFDIIGVEGSLSDVVNVIFAMKKNVDGNRMNINDIVKVVTDFRDQHVRTNSASDLWIPTHVAHDAELDDALAVVLLQHMVQVAKAEPLQVLVQLPAFKKFQDDVAPKLTITAHNDRSLGTSTILYDTDSRNPGPIAAYWCPAANHSGSKAA